MSRKSLKRKRRMAKGDELPSLGDLVQAGSPNLLKKASRSDRERLFKTPIAPLLQEGISIHAESHFSGPIPPPEMLAHYESIVPGLASRIIAMAENQSSHRQALESLAIPEQLSQGRRGQNFGFFIGFLAIITSGCVGMWGDPNVGVSIAVMGLGTLATSFVVGQIRQKKELDKKA